MDSNTLKNILISCTLLGVGMFFLVRYIGERNAKRHNERRFVVAAEYLEDAQALLDGHRNLYEPSFVNLPVKSRIRIVVEALTFGWCFPSGSKKNHQQE